MRLAAPDALRVNVVLGARRYGIPAPRRSCRTTG